MEKRNKVAGILIILAFIIIGVTFFTNTVTDLTPARFISADASHPTFSPNEQIRVDYTYKNTWDEKYQFKVEGELDNEQYQYKQTGLVYAGNTFSDTMYFTAPSTEGTYEIELEGSIYFGHWVDGDGHASIMINVEDPKANLIISSNVPNVDISCSNGQNYIIDDTNQIAIENLDLDTEYQFDATLDGYYSETFSVTPIDVDNTYALTMAEIPVAEEDPETSTETPVVTTETSEVVAETPTNEELVQDNEKITFEMVQGEEEKSNAVLYVGGAIALILFVAGIFLMRK